MILTAHQPVYLPWLGLFHKIALADVFVSFNQVQYQPKDWNNRNQVKTSAGPKWLSVPVKRAGYLEKTISDIEIDNSLPWARKHWKTLHLNYHRAPHFDRYALVMEIDGADQLVFKHAIVTVSTPRAIANYLPPSHA